MPEFLSLEKPPSEETRKLNEELKKNPELKPRLTFAFPISERRREIIKTIKSGSAKVAQIRELLGSTDVIERNAGVYLLGKKAFPMGEWKDVEPIFRDAIRSSNLGDAEFLIRALGDIGEPAIPLLEAIPSWNIGDYVMEIASAQLTRIKKIRPLLNSGADDFLPFLEEKIKAQDGTALKAIAQEATVFRGDMAPILEKIIAEGEFPASMEAMSALMRNTEEPIQIIERLLNFLNSKGGVDISIKQTELIALLDNLGEKAIPLLKSLRQSYENDPNLRICIERAILVAEHKSNLRKWLLSSRKPLFATPYTPELMAKLEKVNEVSNQLKDSFKDKFVGIIVVGSTAKGYFQEGSDLDAVLIAKDSKVYDLFLELAKPLGLCGRLRTYAEITAGKKIYPELISILFSGMFFGDFKVLRELQANSFLSCYKEDWEGLRKQLLFYETNIWDFSRRYGMTTEEILEARQIISLLRIPPSYEEMKSLMEERMGGKTGK